MALEIKHQSCACTPRIILPLAAALALAGCVLGLAGCKEKPEAEITPTVTVQVGGVLDQTIQRKVISDATLYPLDQAAIVPKVASPVKKFYVARGANVRAGQLLAEMESRDLAGAVVDNQGGFEQAQAAYASAVQKAKNDLEVARKTYEVQKKQYDNRVVLFREGAIAQKDVDDASVALTQAQTQLDSAQKALDVKIAEAQVVSARGKVTSAQANLEYAKIVSPINGVVTDRPLFAGETPASGTPVITVMNVSSIVARAHVTPQEAASMKVGDAAQLSSGTGPALPGKVTLVSPALDPNSTTVEIWVQAANPRNRLKPGASAKLTVITETVAHAAVAPAQALLTKEGSTYVIVLDSDNRPHKRKVTTGIRDGSNIQITQGLKTGERVVTVGAYELFNEDDPILAKTKIQVQSPPVPEDDEDE